MGDDVVSAVPSDLLDWSGWTRGLNTDLQGAAKRLNQAISDMNASRPDPTILGVLPFTGNAAIGYAARNDSTDTWVGRVGQAFLSVATRGLPGGLVRADYDDFRSGLVTTDQGAIASRVGGDPTFEAEQVRRATELAEQLRQAIDAGDEGRIRELLQQLAGDEFDPAFTMAFFEELGPNYVLAVMPAMEGDDRLLWSFDNALATATRAPGWNPGFNEALWPGPGRGWVPSSYTDVLLLKYGVYSEDFLTRAGDNILLGGKYDRNGSVDPYTERLALGALGRNPDAALHYLLGHAFQPEIGGPSFQTRAVELLLYFRQAFEVDPGLAGAMGGLIASAAQSGDADTVIVGPFGQEPQIQALLHLLGEGYLLLPDSPELRRGIASAIGQHIDLFTRVDSGAEWTWQKRVFWEAETNGRGEVLQDQVDTIERAAATWAAQHMPGTYAPTDSGSWERWQDWADQTGNLYGLAALPERQAGYDEEHLRERQARFWATVEELVPIPIPEGHRILEYSTEVVKIATARVIEEWRGGASAGDGSVDADVRADAIFATRLAGMRLAMTQVFLARHPSLVPAGRDPLDFATSVASGEHLHHVDIDHFQDLLARQSLNFSEQYHRPTTH
jgi:hypothetical protein